MFLLQAPSSAQIESVLRSQRALAPLYNLANATRDYHAIELGSGAPVFRRAVRALESWEMMDLGWLRAYPSGNEVAIVIRHYGFWSVNVAGILRRAAAGSFCEIAYGTLPEHAESGEERFAVTHREDGTVWYEIEAYSRPRHWLAKIGYPLTRALQKRFARDSMARMRHLAPADEFE